MSGSGIMCISKVKSLSLIYPYVVTLKLLVRPPGLQARLTYSHSCKSANNLFVGEPRFILNLVDLSVKLIYSPVSVGMTGKQFLLLWVLS